MKYKIPLPKNVNVEAVSPKGKYVHENFPESKYAVDFLVDIGTPVLAAHRGVVFKMKSDSNRWGLDKKFLNDVNFVAINHRDGTYAEYLHLGKDKVVVKNGDEVKAGDVLGYTGYSGVMDIPHLHFNVFKIEEGKGVSIPFELEGT